MVSLEGIGDAGSVGGVKKDDAEFGVDADGVLNDAVDEACFGDGAEADAGGCGAEIAGAVGFGAGDEDFVGGADLGLGPVLPAFVGAAGEFVLVDDDFELVGAELGGEGVDAVFVEGAVVAVADEDFGHGRW